MGESNLISINFSLGSFLSQYRRINIEFDPETGKGNIILVPREPKKEAQK